MISTRNLSLSDVPREWIYEHYLTLKEKLVGQDLKIKSVFNSAEKTPSMCIYTDTMGIYKYKDFSSGYGGDALDLVQKLFSLPSRGAAAMKVINDFDEYTKNNHYTPAEKHVIPSRYKVTDYEMRHWNNLDQTYWTSYHIGSKLLERYNVVPLSFYTLSKEDENGVLNTITIKTNFIYGYFKDDGSLYKIYQPKVKDNKFIKVKDYIQGTEQLTYTKKYLVIVSSLKDLMAFNKLSLDAEAIAPDSENSIISGAYMKEVSSKYANVCVLFDNDEPGIKAAVRYNQIYGFKYVILDKEKDLSDTIQKIGVEQTRELLIPLLKSAL
jgi:hypothetical protein